MVGEKELEGNCAAMKPQRGDHFKGDTIVNKAVGMMTEKKSLARVTKKSIGSLEMAASVEHWSSGKEQKAEKEGVGEKVMWRSFPPQSDG